MFFVVGAVLFILYAGMLLWIVSFQNKRERESDNNNPGYYERHQPYNLDSDGDGNQGRTTHKLKVKAPKLKKGSQSRRKDYTCKFKEE